MSKSNSAVQHYSTTWTEIPPSRDGWWWLLRSGKVDIVKVEHQNGQTMVLIDHWVAWMNVRNIDGLWGDQYRIRWNRSRPPGRTGEEDTMKNRHVIYGWTSKRSKLTNLFKWCHWHVRILRTGDDAICITKGRRSDWCPTDWPPKRVKVTVEEV